MGDIWNVRFRGETIPYSPRLHERSNPAKGQTLPPIWIGFDSEAATMEDGFPEVQTYQVHNGIETRFEYVETGAAFTHFWAIVIQSIPDRVFSPVSKRLKTVPVYCHNWEYDWSMIVKDGPEGWQNQSKMNVFYKGFTDTVRVGKQTWKVTVENGHMIGSAPTLVVTIQRKGLGCRLRLLDTYPFFPKALSAVLKDLGMEKGDRASVIGVDWRIKSYGEIVTAKNENGETVEVTKEDFEAYGRGDGLAVWTLGERIRQLHEIEGLTTLAVSGAGYAAKVMLRNLDAPYYGGHGGIKAVQLALDGFHGGRSGRLVHGRISGGSMYDIRSSYPSVQHRLPALHSECTLVYRHNDMEVTDFMRLAKQFHGLVRVSGVERDARYPSILSANSGGSIRPIVGEFTNVPATAAEVYMGVVFGGLEITSIQEAVFYAPIIGMEDMRPFRGFINRAWRRKNSHAKGTIEYDASKIQANSGYGKLIEHRGAQKMIMDHIQIPLRIGGVAGEEEARNFFLGIHPDYWHDFVDEWMKKCDTIAGYTYLHLLINTKPEFGYYVCPQYATWITGHAHARLVLMMRLFDGVKWDTDSVTTLLSEKEVRKRIKKFHVELLPDYIQPLSIGNELGELDMEGRNLSGVILGNKRYFLEGEVKKDGKWVAGHKEGHHGLPGISKPDIRPVLFGESKTFMSKPRPVKVLSAPNWRWVGTFRQKLINPTFLADEKQDWSSAGAYKAFGGFKEETPAH